MNRASSLSAELAAAIAAAVNYAEGGQFHLCRVTPVGGGCISRNLRIGDGKRVYFVKVSAKGAGMFAAEAEGLAALAQCKALTVPRVIAIGETAEAAFLVLEWLDLEQGDDARLGDAVAALHGITFERFGWSCDNFIGATPQKNAWADDWMAFFIARRLTPQLTWAATRGAPALAAAAAPLLAELPQRFAGYAPAASLVHGDLWSGNVGFVRGRPAVFDPATYAGDGETDIAMSELFGGFSPRFYAAYRAHRPEPADGATLRALYRLYHVLNHVNVFGGGYARQALALIDRCRRCG